MLTKIDHIGIAVHSIAQARLFYEQALGLVCEKEEEVVEQLVRTAFFALGEVHIELLEPTSSKSTIAKFLASRGEGIHHIAYCSNDLNAQLAQVSDHGCQLLQQSPMVGAGGKQVAFIHPKSTHGVLTEFCSPCP